MNLVANLALRPLLFVDIDGNFRVPAVRPAATAPGEAVGEVPTMLHDVEGAPIRTDYSLPIGSHSRTSCARPVVFQVELCCGIRPGLSALDPLAIQK